MIKGGSKRKGSSFERQICRSLSLWISCGEREDVFWRSALSGGVATIARSKGKILGAQTGDLSAINSLGEPFLEQFYCEIKFYASLDYHGLLTGTGTLIKFWSSTVSEANCYKKTPMLIAKQNHQPITVCLHAEGKRILNLNEHSSLITCHRHSLFIYSLDEFVKLANPQW